jgi:TolB-like protein/thioredoxin-like negative regulator of GroEL
LTNAVGKLRKAIGDQSRSPRLIETISKRGYRLKVAPTAPGERRPTQALVGRAGGRWGRARRAALVAGVVALGAGAYLYWGGSPGPPAPEVAREGAASIAVIPFDWLGDEASQAFFAEGITLDLITELSRLPGLLVIAPGTMLGYRETAHEDRAIAAELGVQYLIRGAVQRIGDRVRIHVRLLDSERGRTLWAERFAGDAGGLFRIQDEVVRGIASALPVRLQAAPLRVERGAATASIAAYEEFLRGRERYGRMTPEDNRIALSHFQRAVEMDPGFARAHAGLALAGSRLAIDGWTEDPEGALGESMAHADRAAAIDPTLPEVHFVRGQVELFRGRRQEAAEEAAAAIRSDPNYADAYALLAWVLNYSGRPDRALVALAEARRRNPGSSASYREIAGEIAFTQGLYGQAALELQAALERNPTHTRARLWLAASLARLGQREEAAWQVQELLSLNPELSLSRLVHAFPLADPEHCASLARSLAELGLPE